MNSMSQRLHPDCHMSGRSSKYASSRIRTTSASPLRDRRVEWFSYQRTIRSRGISVYAQSIPEIRDAYAKYPIGPMTSRKSSAFERGGEGAKFLRVPDSRLSWFRSFSHDNNISGVSSVLVCLLAVLARQHFLGSLAHPLDAVFFLVGLGFCERVCRPGDLHRPPCPGVPASDSVIVLLNTPVQVFRYTAIETFVRTAEQIDRPALHPKYSLRTDDPVKACRDWYVLRFRRRVHVLITKKRGKSGGIHSARTDRCTPPVIRDAGSSSCESRIVAGIGSWSHLLQTRPGSPYSGE